MCICTWLIFVHVLDALHTCIMISVQIKVCASACQYAMRLKPFPKGYIVTVIYIQLPSRTELFAVIYHRNMLYQCLQKPLSSKKAKAVLLLHCCTHHTACHYMDNNWSARLFTTPRHTLYVGTESVDRGSRSGRGNTERE